MSNLFIISGPSGAGEDSVIDGLRKFLPIERVITTTTRAPRAGESAGHPYYFTSREDFKTRIQNAGFVEYARQYNDQLYGVTREEIERVRQSGRVGIWKIEYQGVMTAKRLFPDIVAIMINAPLAVLEQRLRRRDHPSEKILQERLTYSAEWLKHTDIYDYIVDNEENRLDQAIEATRAIIERHTDASLRRPAHS